MRTWREVRNFASLKFRLTPESLKFRLTVGSGFDSDSKFSKQDPILFWKFWIRIKSGPN